jgi:hypothetical protein
MELRCLALLTGCVQYLTRQKCNRGYSGRAISNKGMKGHSLSAHAEHRFTENAETASEHRPAWIFWRRIVCTYPGSWPTLATSAAIFSYQPPIISKFGHAVILVVKFWPAKQILRFYSKIRAGGKCHSMSELRTRSETLTCVSSPIISSQRCCIGFLEGKETTVINTNPRATIRQKLE